MKLRSLLAVCCVLWLADPGLAQSRTTRDQISGVWTGDMGPNDKNRQPITVTLKFDGKVVTGTITGPPSPGEITKGTFDAKTGVLKLEVIVQNSAKTVVNFDGKVVKDTATGSVKFDDNRTGTFKIARKPQSQGG